MTKIVLSGFGKMGKEIFSILEKRNDVTLFTTEDVTTFDPVTASESICIDFTTPTAFRANYRFIADNFRSAVIGTTGWDDIREEVTDYFRAGKTTMIYASNFSTGINIFFELARISSILLSAIGEYDSYITEFHHKFKIDAPSGTAVRLKNIVESNTGQEIPVHSVRSGYIPGIHTLGFESAVDRITITHEAFSRRGFAQGAIQAAFWTLEKEGVFEFRELLKKWIDKKIYNENV